MKLIRHLVASLIIFSVLVICFVNIYNGYQDGYSFEDGDVKTINETTGNVMEQLQSLTIISSITTITEGLVNIKPSGASLTDIIGGLAAVGIGVLGTVVGVLIFPYQIVNRITAFYFGSIPGGIITGLLLLISVYVGFIVVSAYLKHDI